jgi:hypothetical protein
MGEQGSPFVGRSGFDRAGFNLSKLIGYPELHHSHKTLAAGVPSRDVGSWQMLPDNAQWMLVEEGAQKRQALSRSS